MSCSGKSRPPFTTLKPFLSSLSFGQTREVYVTRFLIDKSIDDKMIAVRSLIIFCPAHPFPSPCRSHRLQAFLAPPSRATVRSSR